MLHVSDIHFGPPHLYGRFAALKELAEEADAVAVSGDLTQRAKPIQFEAALRNLQIFAKPVIAVPGNHDVPLYPVHLRFFAPFYRWRKYYSGRLNCRLRIKGVALHAINTAHGLTSTEGKFTWKTRQWLKNSLFRTSPHEFQILVLHHPILPIPGDSRDRSIRGSQNLLSLLAGIPIDLVLAGHVHRSVTQDVRDYYPGFPYLLPVSHCGSTTTVRGRGKEKKRTSCQVVRVGPRSFSVTNYLWSHNGFLESEKRTFSRRQVAKSQPSVTEVRHG